ncbi:MAG: hypothetical protein RL277_1994 [Planctomycetota bacterium]|jgi:hypothetical protein
MSAAIALPLTELAVLDPTLRREGWAVIRGADLHRALALPAGALMAWQDYWERLAPDRYLRDGGHYRRRRHGSFLVSQGVAQAVTHRAHWQPLEYNALHGGLERWFEPLEPSWMADPLLARLLVWLAGRAEALLQAPAGTAQRWFAEVHPFRIDTAEGIGRPTPEGAHRDGVDLVAVILVDRHRIKGGETRVFDADGPAGRRFTLSEAWSALLLDDARVIHETTPIQPLEPGQTGHRDTLVVTLRRGGFQEPAGLADRD